MKNEVLIELINENGLSILNDEIRLTEKLSSKFSQEEIAIIMLIFSKKEFLNKLKNRNKSQIDIARTLSELYHFNEEYASLITKDLLNIFSDSQLDIWSKNILKGINNFKNLHFKCSRDFGIIWRPKYYSFCYIECRLCYELDVVIKDFNKTKKFINTKNKFINEDKVIDILQNLIIDEIENDFSDFCYSDDEVEPFCDEYCGDIIDEISEKYGLEIKILKWDTDTSNYMTD